MTFTVCGDVERRKDRNQNINVEFGNVAIGNPERYVRKASHRGSKQQ